MKHILLAGFVSLRLLSSAQAGMFYTDPGDFQTALNGLSYTETFDTFVSHGGPNHNGDQPYDAPGGNGYDFDLFSSHSSGIFELPGRPSVFGASHSMQFVFTGASVTAFGGDFATTDTGGSDVSGSLTFLASTGESLTLSTPSASFIGYISSTPLTDVTISPASSGIYVAADNVALGAGTVSAVPEPSTFALLGIGSIALVGYGYRRKRQQAA